MSNKPFKKTPSVLEHTKSDLVEEVSAWHKFFVHEWRWLMIVLASLAGLLIFSKPLPPRDVYIAASQPGSTFELIAKKFVPYFEKEGIRLHLVNTAGSGASIDDLADRNVKINAALLVAGVAEHSAYPHLRSLGSLEHVPLWFFYRGPEFSGKGVFKHFSDKKIAVGLDKSGTQIITRKVLNISHIDLDDRPNFLRLSTKEAVQRLTDGDIDGMIVLDGPEGPNVQRLLSEQNLNIFNFVHAKTYATKLPFLEMVTLPRGVLSVEENRPDQNIDMLASTLTLLVEEDLHPAIQKIFLMAATEISKDQSHLFGKPDRFPAYLDRSIDISPVAKQFYDNGPSFLYRFLPIWLANYVERIWFYVFGFFAVIIPLSRLFPSLRIKHSVWVVSEAYEEIQSIEKEAARTQSDDDLRNLIDRLDLLDAETRESWVTSDEMNRLYTMKGAINLLRMKLYKRLSHTDQV